MEQMDTIMKQRLRLSTIRLFTGVVLFTTGAMPRVRHRDLREGFLFNCNSLSAERAQYPCSLRDTRLKRL